MKSVIHHLCAKNNPGSEETWGIVANSTRDVFKLSPTLQRKPSEFFIFVVICCNFLFLLIGFLLDCVPR